MALWSVTMATCFSKACSIAAMARAPGGPSFSSGGSWVKWVGNPVVISTDPAWDRARQAPSSSPWRCRCAMPRSPRQAFLKRAVHFYVSFCCQSFPLGESTYFSDIKWVKPLVKAGIGVISSGNLRRCRIWVIKIMGCASRLRMSNFENYYN